MAKKEKYKSTESLWCYASYENDQVCMSCRAPGKDGILLCTALKETSEYKDSCPFFCPMCVHRVNGIDGFKKCKLVTQRNLCDGAHCPDFKPMLKGAGL